MAYTPTNWKRGDIVTSEKLNKLENGVASAGSGGEDTSPLVLEYGDEYGSDVDVGASFDDIVEAFLAGRQVRANVGTEVFVVNGLCAAENHLVATDGHKTVKVEPGYQDKIKISLLVTTDVTRYEVTEGSDGNGTYLEINATALDLFYGMGSSMGSNPQVGEPRLYGDFGTGMSRCMVYGSLIGASAGGGEYIIYALFLSDPLASNSGGIVPFTASDANSKPRFYVP